MSSTVHRLALAAGLALALGCGEEEAPEPAARALPPPPVARAPAPLVVTATGRAAVPPEVRESAREKTARPPLELVTTQGGPAWRTRRALVRDRATGDVRAYAVGDLLPHGATLTGIEEGRVRLAVGGGQLVLELDAAGDWSVQEDFRSARRPRRRRARPRAGLSTSALAAARAAIDALATSTGAPLEAAIGALVGAGESVVPELARHLGDRQPVLQEEVAVRGRITRAELRGDRVVALLEAITGQGFGDPLQPGARAEVIRAWRHWAGLD